MRSEHGERIYGPYKDRNGWRVVIVRADGARLTKSYPSEAKARAIIDEFRAATDARSVSGTVDEYLADLRLHVRESTLATTRSQLRELLDYVDHDRALRDLTPRIAKSLFARRSATTAGDTQHGGLGAASRFCRWCVAKGWLARDPFAGLKPTKARRAGKPQLRIDETRKLLETALAERSDEGLVVALTIVLGVRASELTDRSVRDVDDGARVLWIDRAKTRHGVRRLEIPEFARAAVAALVAGRAGGEPLWRKPGRDRHWLARHVRRLCKRAGVPVVPPHGIRGTWSTLSRATLPTEQVATALGHGSTAVTERHYLDADGNHAASGASVLHVLAGGRS